MAKGWKKTTIFWAVTGVLLGVLSWALYRLIYQGAADGLAMFGIENAYAQNIVVVVAAAIILLSLGVGGKKILKKIAD